MTVSREFRIERDAEQAAFARRIDCHRQKRRRQQHAAFDYAETPPLFADEEPTVRRNLHRGWTCQAARDDGFGEACRNGRRTQRHVRNQAP